MNLKNLVFANRLSQQVVKLGKDIESDRDILEQELLKPSKNKAKIMSTSLNPTDPALDDPHDIEGHTQPTVKQLIDYKQKIRLENDRRLHRQNLADLARKEREKVQILQPDLDKSAEIRQQQQQQPDEEDRKSTRLALQASAMRSTEKTVAKSKEEEEVLHDENIFRPQRQRNRERQRNRTSRSNSPYLRREFSRNLSSTMGKGLNTSTPVTQFVICKVCGNTINTEGDQSQRDVRQVSGKWISLRIR